MGELSPQYCGFKAWANQTTQGLTFERRKLVIHLLHYNKLVPDGLEFKIMETRVMLESNTGEYLYNLEEILPTYDTKAEAIIFF